MLVMEIDTVAFMPGRPGWLEFRIEGEDSPRLLVKLALREGRWAPQRLIVDGGVLDARTLRAIPWGRIEAEANRYPADSEFLNKGTAYNASPEEIASLTERGEVFHEEFGQIDGALDRYLAETQEKIKRGGVRRKTRREPLARPDGSDPEAFSQRVAEAYNDVVSATSAPAKKLAEEAGVPVSAVHRWVREARRRGYLPPARQGRAG